MELFKLRAGVEHLHPNDDGDVLPCYETRDIVGFGLADKDLTDLPFIPFRVTGTRFMQTELLVSGCLFLVMTPRLLHFLESLGDFPHQVIPAHLVPDRDDWRDHPPIDTTSFVVCNLHKHLHIIDFPRCELTPFEIEDGMRRIDHIALVEGATVPPLFRQDDWCLPPLIPRSTRDALIQEGFTDLFLPPLLGEGIRLADIKLPPW
jgi:hypothetical protein